MERAEGERPHLVLSMAIEFKKQVKRQKTLIYIFSTVIIITGIVLWVGFLKPEKIPEEEIFLPTLPVREVEINWDVLKNPFLEKLQTFEGIPSLSPEEEIGRQNPFTPY